MIERALMVNRRTWLIIVSGFFEPLFYLLSIRVGFGELVGDVDVGGQSIPYAEFVAPALMAASAMNGAVYDSTMNVFFKLQARQALRHRAGDADGAGRRGARRDRLGGDPRLPLLGRLPGHDVGARHDRLAVGRAVAADLRADRLRLRRRWAWR